MTRLVQRAQSSLTVCAIAALLMTSTAHAVTITNRGDQETILKVLDGASQQDLRLPGGKVVEGVCQKGCIIRLNDSGNGVYELRGSDVVSVEEGFLYYDDATTEGAPTRGGAVPLTTSPVR